jgi:hypothetical protein
MQEVYSTLEEKIKLEIIPNSTVITYSIIKKNNPTSIFIEGLEIKRNILENSFSNEITDSISIKKLIDYKTKSLTSSTAIVTIPNVIEDKEGVAYFLGNFHPFYQGLPYEEQEIQSLPFNKYIISITGKIPQEFIYGIISINSETKELTFSKNPHYIGLQSLSHQRLFYSKIINKIPYLRKIYDQPRQTPIEEYMGINNFLYLEQLKNYQQKNKIKSRKKTNFTS